MYSCSVTKSRLSRRDHESWWRPLAHPLDPGSTGPGSAPRPAGRRWLGPAGDRTVRTPGPTGGPEISMEPMRFARIEAKKSQMTISSHLKHCPFTMPPKWPERTTFVHCSVVQAFFLKYKHKTLLLGIGLEK